MPYNGTLFSVNLNYDEVFQNETKFEKRDEYPLGEETYKIKYELNIIPHIGMYIDEEGEKVNPDVSLMSIMCESNELNLFNCQVVQDLI